MPPLHVLVMTDRDWTHPQGGGTGTNLYGQIARWVAWGHRVSVIACSYPGAKSFERFGDSLEVHRLGGRSTVFPRAILAQWRGLVPDPDVVLEVVNGITFLTPLWLDRPRVTLVHHVHRDHYVEELGGKGRVAAWLLETVPLRWLYRGSRFLTISHATAEDIAWHGIPLDEIDVGYIGVEADAFGRGERADTPELLYLGRLKRYKRVEVVLDALEAVPEALLHIAGDGDHRAELEREIAARGLSDRVVMHGFVSEDEKRELLQRAWVNLTASSAEGWALSVMEAAACGTPSVALGVGGLKESVVHGKTGLLAATPAELAERTREVVRDPQLRERLSAAALERAREFTWERTARETLSILEDEVEKAPERHGVRAPDVGLAAAVVGANVVALAFTALFARLLGTAGYGSLAALVAAFLILQVPGSALQLSVARSGEPSGGWLRRLVVVTLACAGASVVLREPLASLIGVSDAWAAACALPAGCLWLILSVERGALQHMRRYRLVGWSIVCEAGARLAIGVALYGAGLGVTGAFLGTVLSVLATCLVLAPALRRARPTAQRLRSLLGRDWVAVLALTLLGVLQYVDLIVVKHRAPGDAAGAYAAASVAARTIVWVAIGLGLYLLPEAARRVRSGLDARPLLVRTVALICGLALPLLAVSAFAAGPLLSVLFDVRSGAAADALPLLAAAMALQACAYLGVLYLVALGDGRFLWLLGLAALMEPVLLGLTGAHLTSIALALLGLQLALAASVLAVALAAGARRRAPTPA
jgi:glycosyltransferase involved in cell wall biosynthesis/O-antigen/teichoic acid export membrane protein